MTGGILSIVSGVIAFFCSMGLFIASTILNYADRWVNNWGFNGLPINIGPIFAAIAIPLLLCGILAVVGGIFALQRKCWGLALAGAIAAFFPVWILGLGSVVFIAISHDEFKPIVKNTAAAAVEKSS